MDHDLLGIITNKQIIQLAMPQIKCYTRQILNGLAYIHANRVMHRDLKSENILVSNAGNIKIADFGLCREASDRIKAEYTQTVVTRYYRAPELLVVELADERRHHAHYTSAIDIWSCGVILAEMVHRSFLFPGSSDLQTLHLIFQLVGHPKHRLWKNLPPKVSENTFKTKFPKQPSDFYSMLYHMLDLHPVQRFSAAQLLDHEWFVKDPKECLPGECPRYEQGHLFGARQ